MLLHLFFIEPVITRPKQGPFVNFYKRSKNSFCEVTDYDILSMLVLKARQVNFGVGHFFSLGLQLLRLDLLIIISSPMMLVLSGIACR